MELKWILNLTLLALLVMHATARPHRRRLSQTSAAMSYRGMKPNCTVGGVYRSGLGASVACVSNPNTYDYNCVCISNCSASPGWRMSGGSPATDGASYVYRRLDAFNASEDIVAGKLFCGSGKNLIVSRGPQYPNHTWVHQTGGAPVAKLPNCTVDGGFVGSTGRQIRCVQNPTTGDYICTCVGRCDPGIISAGGTVTPDGSGYKYWRYNFVNESLSSVDTILCKPDIYFNGTKTNWTRTTPRTPSSNLPSCTFNGGWLAEKYGIEIRCVQNPTSLNKVCICVRNCPPGMYMMAGAPQLGGKGYSYYRNNFGNASLATFGTPVTDEVACYPPGMMPPSFKAENVTFTHISP